MTTTDSPAAARRRLRFALRNAREAAQLTQADVAARLEWSVSKVNRIEGGEVTISGTDLRALMQLLGVTDEETVKTLTTYAKVARQRGWWDDPELRPHLTPAMRQLIQYEAEATTIRCFQPTLIPGALQTPSYARAILDFWIELPQETRDVRQTIRMERRRRLFGDAARARYLLLIDESVVQRQVGGPAVMAEQLRLLLSMMKEGSLVVRIIPLIHGAIIGQAGSFTILDLEDGDESAILYREIALDDDNIRDDREVVAHYRRAFEQGWAVALSPEDSAALIEGHAASMNASIHRPRPGG